MWNNLDNGIFNAFLILYLNELESSEELINSLSNAVYHLDEANPDREARQAVKEYMQKYPTLPNCEKMNLKVEGNGESQRFSYSDLSQVKIRNIYLSEEITENMKENIKLSKGKSVYTEPDIYLKLEYKGYEYFTEIELKSTKKNQIHGSSVQQINPSGWVIFIKQGNKKNGNKVKLTTGLYINSITEKMYFPDRSPRPQVAFNTLTQWNDENFKLEDDGFTLNFSEEAANFKYKIITDWKQVLVTRWIESIFNENLKFNENTSWFTETIAIFVEQLMQKYDALNEDEKINFREKISSVLINH